MDAEGLRDYRLALAREARRFKPPASRTLGEAGQVDILLICGSGPLPLARIEHSSGSSVLDDAALLMIKNAAAHAEIPESLRGQRIRLRVPVRFE